MIVLAVRHMCNTRATHMHCWLVLLVGLCWLAFLVGNAGWYCCLVLLVGVTGWQCRLVLLVGVSWCRDRTLVGCVACGIAVVNVGGGVAGFAGCVFVVGVGSVIVGVAVVVWLGLSLVVGKFCLLVMGVVFYLVFL